ncbi:hypothetical protein B0H66DRAFT_165573 [Apodospora peruviana]|uniref:Uncharacterized protein n=1 Tax=Apodospora peruviana TaxID=516989 RepID=A0AAE0IK34_9PEZI|nr:hypothetical protein B0H66DRAFT_165573 [Apodospora peruviana]
MHRLVQLVPRAWLSMKGSKRDFAEKALLVVSEVYPHNEVFGNWPVCGAYLAHAYSVLKLERTESKYVEISKATLCHSISAFLYHDVEDLKAAEKFLLQAVELRTSVLGERSLDTIERIRLLAIVNLDQGRMKEAELSQVQSAELAADVLGKEHRTTLKIQHDLALCYLHQGRREKAELLQRHYGKKMICYWNSVPPSVIYSICKIS